MHWCRNVIQEGGGGGTYIKGSDIYEIVKLYNVCRCTLWQLHFLRFTERMRTIVLVLVVFGKMVLMYIYYVAMVWVCVSAA